jgi:hypothetical protein
MEEQLKTDVDRMIRTSHHIGMYAQKLVSETVINENYDEDKCDRIAAKVKSLQDELDGLRKKWGV